MTKTISATVIADSVSPDGDRITTLELTFPRFLLAELNTHRAFSRNSASSRARSTKKTIQEVRDDPFVPSHWPSERPGMAGGANLVGDDLYQAKVAWQSACDEALHHADILVEEGVHKSIVNRLLEPFQWHTAVVTATDWDGFFDQRLAKLEDGIPAAEPHFYDLAWAMRTAMLESKPETLHHEDWHLPYVRGRDYDYEKIANTPEYGGNWLLVATKLSVARCAGVSYLNQGADRDPAKDLALYDRLRAADPPHWSPFEHVATPRHGRGMAAARSYNLTGWASLRWFFEAGAAGLNDIH